MNACPPDVQIVSAHFIAGMSAYYFDDQKAIKQGAQQDGFVYQGTPLTGGFSSVRQGGESISVMLQLSTGLWAQGDCCAVQYSGAGGRDPLFIAEHYIDFLDQQIAPSLIGMNATDFLENSKRIDCIQANGRPIHTAIRYGISQALLDAAALSQCITKTEVISQRYQLDIPTRRVPVFAQSGDERYLSIDKMIMRKVDALPHALINNIDDKLGWRGEKLLDYVAWLVARINTVSASLNHQNSYKPKLHIDVYGTIGQLYNNNVSAITDYLAKLAKAAGDYELYIEGPVDMGEKNSQIETMATIKQGIELTSPNLKIVADEWCNTLQDIVNFVDADCCHMAQIKTPDLGSLHNVVEAVLYCKENNIEAYQGGTCNETDISSRCCVQLALATQPERLLIKPGMGFDEGMQIVNNEMQRTLKQLSLQAT